MGIAQRIYQLGNQPSLKRTTSAIPGGDIYGRNPAVRFDRAQRRPISSILEYPLPSMNIMRMLLEEYFDAVHWFSLVIYEPRFRSKFESIQDSFAYPSQKSFLLLLSTVLGMGAWYKSQRSGVDSDFSDEDWLQWSVSLVTGAGSQLTELMDQTSIASVQACILLGSYYVYHGKPNLSFALLGATIRTAHAIGLHRQPLRGDVNSIEERKRVWWTIYTWDRFASVTYGRPLGINDKDCNVTQPIDSSESPRFIQRSSSSSDDSICYSSYQRELNKLYLIASPIIEVVFGMRAMGSSDRNAGPQYQNQIMEVNERLWAWRRRLPAHLLLNLRSDCEPTQSHTMKVHHLQALSLQLTFDSLLIIFHRPLLAQQVDHLIRTQPESGPGMTSPSALSNTTQSPFFAASGTSPQSGSQAPSTEQWWDAALRTSKVTEMPQLAQLATDSHLVAFLAINLFNSAIVMAVLALSDPLSDRAQEVKRTITRIFRLQELLGKKTQLSMQSNIVLKDVIRMLLRREADAMLGGITSAELEVPLMSVEETLRLPMQVPLGRINNTRDKRNQSTADRAMRLNESLASVQRVFPTGQDTGYSDNATTYQERAREEGTTTQLVNSGTTDWSNVDFESLGINGDVDWSDDAGVDLNGNGLYWFWDSIWSEPQL
ncbi:hypothetical protein T440DRAFT_268291 [Plenodomus tracheiphilus IPT5]|uniref:Xylanolytic transcriptional activator regulatory domain-containing protein n=1 Tax=Plenodomus tracheiphilus IPT5 TaxID=1408161 RepID=A0A6A7BI83_9PLEO|nr:hypothetical protein T440DRAFT_268291 [Plenodomus tracheiphilus IPT5]